MANQQQEAQQQRMFNRFGGGAASSSNNPVLNFETNGSSNAAQEPNESFTSFVNAQMRYDHNQSVADNQRYDTCTADSGDIKVLCLLSFIGCCDSNRMAFGPYCLVHNKILFGRSFMATSNDGSVAPMVSVSLAPTKARRSMVLLSTLPGSPTENDLTAIFEPFASEMDGVMYNNLIKFFLLLTSQESIWNSDVYLNDFKRYMTDVSAGYYKFVSKYTHVIERTMVSVGISPEHFRRIRNNTWWIEIFRQVNQNLISAVDSQNNITGATVEERNMQNSVYYLIPLGLFNIIDILTILSFNFEIRFGEIGYQPNVEIYNGAFFIGTGYGINNAIQSNNQVLNFSNYPLNIAKILREKFGNPQHNVDYLILNVSPLIHDDTVPHSIAIAERRLDKVSICLEKISRKTN